ncbi:MAG: FumA C-terminus/TtdB family hydratase beta subunit [Candidatus Hadarchaeales archaeon]
MKTIKLTTPLKDVSNLNAGDFVMISGTIVTARDKAYARVAAGEKPPFVLNGGVVYNCGPLVRKRNGRWEVFSAGPTTSARMDKLQVDFVKRTGVRAIIGKGGLGREVAEEISRLGCVYLAFPGGTGALAAEFVERVESVCWLDLGEPEAMWLLKVKDFGPLLVAIDAKNKNLYAPAKRGVF